ncbi:MAG: hypothetical protein QOE93_1654, partial [Actinomycetota bacterium]|nr:hypothetical protein [Actinomycetota bacterium]
MRGVPTATRVSSGRRQRPTLQVLALLTALVAAFSKLWIQGAVVLDGQGATLYARLLSDYLIHRGRIPYWIPEVWSGTPGWALAPSFPLMLLLPLTSMAGPDVALKVGVLAFQVIGGLGAYVLARSLWGRGPGPVLAGIFYALHPMIVSHGALVGLEPILGVTAATPWLMWSFRLALLGGGRKYVVVGALSAAFAVLHQAEYALCLPLMCGFMLLVELAHSREDPVHGTPGQVLKRAGAIVGLGLALCAFWLLPLGSLRNSFVLSPPELVQAELTGGTANLISNNMGTFFNRPGSITGVVSHQRPDLVPPLCYLGLVCAAMTMVTLFLLPRRDRDGHLTAIMAASGMAVWFSTGSVPLIA